MQVTILLQATCPVCGHRNQGLQVGTAQPRMTGLRLQPGSLGWVPPACQECGHPLGHELFDKGCPDAESTAKWRAWQQRERSRRARRSA